MGTASAGIFAGVLAAEDDEGITKSTGAGGGEGERGPEGLHARWWLENVFLFFRGKGDRCVYIILFYVFSSRHLCVRSAGAD